MSLITLILGLAGLRDAWSALESQPGSTVTVISRRSGPAGSSFANLHNALGMQVCLTDHEREKFVEEAISIAPPGYIDSNLVKAMAEELKPGATN